MDGDDITLMEKLESTFEIRSDMFELPALLHIGGSYDFLLTVIACYAVFKLYLKFFFKDQILFGTEYF